MQIVRDAFVDTLENLEVFRVIGPDEKSIRVAFVPHKAKKLLGSIIVSPGRTEYIEKYAEVAGELVNRGFNVLIVDQRGQGWSDRLAPDPMAGHMDSFDKAATHLSLAVDAAGDRLKGKIILLGHSMGGCIGLEALINGQLPQVSAAAFSAPMWGLMAPKGAQILAKTLNAFGQGMVTAVTTPKIWQPEPFEANTVTHDPKRFARNNALMLAEPALQIAGPTNGWLAEAFKTMASFTAERLAKVQIPVLVMSGEAEQIVDNSAHVRIAGQLPHGALRIIPGAKHELMQETDDLRAEFWAIFDAWVKEIPA